MVKCSDAAEFCDESKTRSSLHLEYVVSKVFTCHICQSEYDTNEKQQKHVNKNHKDVVKGEEFVCKHCGKNCWNNGSNLKVHKKVCKHGKVDKLPLLVYECDSCKCKFTSRFNLHQHIASSPHCRTKIEQLQKGKSSMASNNKDKKQC